MRNTRSEAALKLLGLLGLAAMLAGCTTLTDDLPKPATSSQPSTQPSVQPEAINEWESTWTVDVETGGRELMAESDETIVVQMAGSGSAGSVVDTLAKGETSISWVCTGGGSISIATVDGSSFGAECGNIPAGQINRNSFTNDSPRRFDVDVTADADVSWQVLVTQPVG